MVSPQMLDAAVRWTSPRIRDWAPDPRETVRTWLQPQLDLVDDADWGAQIRDLVGLPVHDPLAWANRRIELADGEWAVAGIRFRGRDVEKPFVDIIATSLAPDVAGIEALGEVMAHFASFSPLALRVAPPDPQAAVEAIDAAAGSSARADVDLFVVAGLVHALRARTEPAEPTEAPALVPADPQSAAERAATIYEELSSSRPRIAEWATPADLDTLRGAAEEELLFDVVVDGASCGVVAAARDDAYGLCGFSVQEICLDAEHRGRGVGRQALQDLARVLPTAHGSEVLWGHIHPENTASLKNAVSVGREIVGGHVWVTPEGYPGMPL